MRYSARPARAGLGGVDEQGDVLGCDELGGEQSIGDTLAEMQAYAMDILRTVIS
jgi:hypothetical protein